jgi:hypothetical protein
LFSGDKDNLRNPKIYNPPREKEKGFNLPKIVYWLAFLLFLVIMLVYWLFFSSYFNIKTVEYVGNVPDEVKEIIETQKGRNIFLINTAQVEEQLLIKNSAFSMIKIYRGIPDTLRLRFEQRNPKIVWQSNGINYLIDENGYVYEESKGENNLPIVVDKRALPVEILQQVGSTKFIDFVRNTDKDLDVYGIKVDHFEIDETTFQIDAVTENFKIIYDVTRPLSEQNEAFKTIFEKNKDDIKEYVDLRVEGWVYYK